MILRNFFLAVILMLFLSQTSWANFAEFYGSSATTSALANQFSDNPDDPSNNYYNPALLAYAKNIGFSYNLSFQASYFRNIQGVVVENSVTGTTTRAGNVDTSYDPSVMSSIHAVIPILEKKGSKLAFSLYFPATGNRSNSLDPLAPEYVMYHSRHERTMFTANWAYPINENWAFSVGGYLGTRMDVDTKGTYRQTSSSPSGSTFIQNDAEASPTLAGLLSVAGVFKYNTIYLGFQQEMKSKLTVNNSGYTTGVGGSLTTFNYTANSTANFDPMIIRAGWSHKWNPYVKHFLTLEYQFWNTYDAPTIQVSRNSGAIVGSTNYAQVKPVDIFVPKLGLEFYVSENSTLRCGLAYMPTPFDNNLSLAGNFIDTDKFIASIGHGVKFKLLGQDAEWNNSAQAHFLQNDQIVKTAGQEDGSGGDKIGAPGYRIGGTAVAITTGININLSNSLR